MSIVQSNVKLAENHKCIQPRNYEIGIQKLIKIINYHRRIFVKGTVKSYFSYLLLYDIITINMCPVLVEYH